MVGRHSNRPRDVTSRAVEGSFGARNPSWGHGKGSDPGPSQASCVPLGNELDFSELQFPHVYGEQPQASAGSGGKERR